MFPLMKLRRRTVISPRLRRDATEMEKRRWRALRGLDSRHRFRRQPPVGPYVVDFACPGVKLAIELDGGQHARQDNADELRTAALARYSGAQLPVTSRQG